MKAYKVTLLVVDWRYLGQASLVEELENVNYPNDCISPKLMRIQEADIGEWSDDHPLNHASSQEAEFQRLFGEEATQQTHQ